MGKMGSGRDKLAGYLLESDAPASFIRHDHTGGYDIFETAADEVIRGSLLFKD